MNMVRRPTRTERGSSILEVAILMPVVVLFFMGAYEFGRLFYTRVTLQQAIHEAARIVGSGARFEDDQGNRMDRDASIIAAIRHEAGTLDIDIDDLSIDAPDRGGASQVVTVSGDFSYEFVTPGIQNLFPDGEYNFSLATSLSVPRNPQESEAER